MKMQFLAALIFLKSLLILSIVILPCSRLSAQGPAYKFVRYDNKRGLSHNQVNCFLKDKEGFLWVGTQAGLNRFDGSSFKVFRNQRGDTNSLANDFVYSLFEDPEGCLWIGDRDNFCVFDPKTERFSRDAGRQARKFGLPDASVTGFWKSKNGDYWFNHTALGVCRYHPGQKKLDRFRHIPNDTASLSGERVADIQEDSNGLLWVVFQNGILEKLDPESKKVSFRSRRLRDLYGSGPVRYNLFIDSDNDVWIYSEDLPGGHYFQSRTHTFYPFNIGSNRFRLGSNIVRAITQDKEGIVWVATDHGGITLIDKQKRRVQYLLHDPADEHSLSQNSAISLYRDAGGSIWVGTFKKGFNHYHKNIFKFPHYRHAPGEASGWPADDINDFVEDATGNIWIGTNGGGLVYFDRKNNRFTRYRNRPGDPRSLSNDVVVSLCIDHEQTLWIGTYFGGLNRFDGQRFTHFVHNPSDPNSLSDDRVWKIYEDSRHNLWVGTLRGGLNLFDRKRHNFRHYRPGAGNSICSDYISALLEDDAGNLWIGTERGLNVLDYQSGSFAHYKNNPADSNSLSHNTVTELAADPAGNLWVATLHGLNLFNKQRDVFRSFGKADGLADDVVMSLLADPKHGLWMGTPNGLSNLTVSNWGQAWVGKPLIRNFGECDGLQGREFNHGAACRTRKGELVFGGPNGFNIIDPENAGGNTAGAKVVLTDFQVFTQSVRPGEKVDNVVVLQQSITETGELTLPHSLNVFSIGFAALNFFHPEKDVYQYQLEGFHKSWYPADNRARKATYTNLDPGNYVFRVRVADETGQWQESRPLKIRITPPFWQSGLAKLLYGLLIVLALAFARWFIRDRERIRLRMEQQAWEARRTHELDLLKIKFLTNISHEFRTPLTLIMTPVEGLLLSSKDPDERAQLSIVQRNAKRLLQLVNQLLDFKNLEVEETRYLPAPGDMVSFLRDLTQSFAEISGKKNIQLFFESDIESLQMDFDQEKMSRALYNLLSNAFKFTPEKGKVGVRLRLIEPAGGKGPAQLEIRVSDTGIGIPEHAREKIFERFYQHTLPESMINHGSGIGLAITREFVRLHRGTIHVESNQDQGSIFIIRLPGVPADYSNVQISTAPGIMPDNPHPFPQHPPAEAVKNTPAPPLLLLVEDDDDFRTYLGEALKSQYDILEAPEGNTAWELVLNRVPDLIVSDIVMPGKSGIELCRQVKSDPRTLHIPVILLTAHSEEEQELLGYETGADAYLAKPFSLDMLAVRIQNLIRQREQFYQLLHRHIDINPSQISITPLDEQLINKAVAVVEKNIANADFSVEELSHALAMSRVYLYKKLSALTGKTPIEFIRVIRLKRAVQLLEKSQLTVAEVAYKVGFNNPKYFARYFREEFGVLPKAYQKKSKNGLPTEGNTVKGG